MTRRLFLVVVSLTLTLAAHGQPTSATHPETGRPFLTCFGPDDTGGSNQDWVFAQDQRGVLYVGDSHGVLEYDGAAWRLIITATNNVVRALDVDDAGRVFVGSAADFGYLAPDAAGEKRYVSLLSYLPEDERAFNDIWTVHATTDGVYFQARERLFRFRQAADGTWQVKAWQPEGVFYYAFWLDGVYYVHQGGVGLMRMVGDALEVLPGGEQFVDERLQVMAPFGDGTYLVGPFSGGLFRFDGQGFAPWATEADGFLRANTLYKGAALPDGSFGLGTLAGGYVVVDRDGGLVQGLNKAGGLPSDNVYAIFVDRSGLVWLSPENGLCQYEARSPLSRYDAASGLRGFATDIVRHEGVLYVSTGDGLYYLDAGVFKPVAGLSLGYQAWSLLRVDGALLLAESTGVYRIEGSTAHPITQNVVGVSSPQALHRSRQDPDRVFVGKSESLGVLRRDAAGTWIEEGAIPDITEEIRFIVEPEPGLFWLGSQTRSILRVRFPDASFENPVIDRFGPEDGLPGGGGASVFEAAGHVVFAMKEGISRFDEAAGRFVPDTLFTGVVGLGGSAEEYTVVEDRKGDVWINFGAETAVLRRQADGAYRAEKTALLRFADEAAYAIYPEADGVVWFGGNESLIRYDPGIEKDYAIAYPALVRRVTVGEDSTLYGGAVSGERVLPRLRFADNGLRFDYAATSYDNPKELRYASMLEGFDAHWSSWTKETRRDYTNLPAGSYTFRVKAKNIYAHESEEATFGFRILSPWYRTWWAYLLYVALAGGLVVGLVRQRTHHLEARQRELEQTVEERTAEIQQRVEELGVINSVQEGLVRELDIQAIYDLVGDRIRDLFDAQVVIIATFDHDADVEHFHYLLEKGERYYPEPRPIKSVRRHLIRTRQVILINEDYEGAMVEFGGSQVVPGTEAPKSLLFVPLVVGEAVKGYVSLQNVDREHAFSESDVRLLTTLANSMSVALENARLFDETNRLLDETEQRAAELDTVNHISRALVAQLEFDALVQLVGEQIRETFRASIVYVALHDRATDMIHFPYEYGDENPSRPFGSGLTEKIILTREPLLINRDLEEVRDQLQAQQIGKVSMSYLGVPIVVGEDAIGVISVQSTEEEGLFDEDDLRLLNTIAAHVGVALQNAEAYRKLNAALEHLRATQEQLVQQEKLASLGALTAGIAHEIKNPLNFVNNFAQLSAELADELNEELDANKDRPVVEFEEDLKEILASLKINAAKIEEHGRRADSIVTSMLQHSRGAVGERQAIDVNALLDEYVNLAYHGMRAQVANFNVTLERDFDAAVGTVEAVPQELGQVLINLLNNAFYAVHDRKLSEDGRYAPTVSVCTRKRKDAVEIRVQDNGPGIPDAVREKIFEPFFTTKPTGSGTGLGLSLSYDIITQRHGGTLAVESTEGQGATFVITLPASGT